MEFSIIANEKDEKDAFGQDKKWEWAEQWEETIVNMNGGVEMEKGEIISTREFLLFFHFLFIFISFAPHPHHHRGIAGVCLKIYFSLDIYKKRYFSVLHVDFLHIWK